VLPSLLSSEIRSNQNVPLKSALDTSWDLVCDTYRTSCMTDGVNDCVAQYDAKEGILYAGMGSSDLFAGSTATISATAISNKGTVAGMTVLNCGDSRTLIVGEPLDGKGTYVYFCTQDHVPSCPEEAARLRANPKFSDPECSMNKFWLTVGDYRYAVSRSLEGPLATSKGIISESELTDVNISKLMKSRSQTMIIQASDGLFEVLGNEEVARDVIAMRKGGLTAQECAKALCKLAIRKGTTDNVTVLVVFLK
jgi:Serine/threonine protein phosphatase